MGFTNHLLTGMILQVVLSDEGWFKEKLSSDTRFFQVTRNSPPNGGHFPPLTSWLGRTWYTLMTLMYTNDIKLVVERDRRPFCSCFLKLSKWNEFPMVSKWRMPEEHHLRVKDGAFPAWKLQISHYSLVMFNMRPNKVSFEILLGPRPMSGRLLKLGGLWTKTLAWHQDDMKQSLRDLNLHKLSRAFAGVFGMCIRASGPHLL